jgi:3-dehydroquinate synthase
MNPFPDLNTCTVAMIGLGYVGLPLAVEFARAGLPVRGPVLDAADNAGHYMAHMRLDKKAVGGEIQFVVIDGPGKAKVCGAPDAVVREVINACCA